MDWVTTSTLLEDLREVEDAPAWDVFVGRFRQPITRFAASTGLRPADAEDVAQETLLAFTQAFRAGRYDRAKGRLSKWLFGIAYRHVLRARRRIGRQERLVSSDTDGTTFFSGVPDEEAAATEWERRWDESALEHCLEQVRREIRPATYRAFELVVMAGCPAPEAAEALGVTVTTIYNAKHRVIKRLRELKEQVEEIET